MTQIESDSFVRSVVSGNWGTATDGHSWTINQAGGTLSTNGAQGQLASSSGVRMHSSLGVTTYTNQEVFCTITPASLSDDFGVDARISGTSSISGYRFNLTGSGTTTGSLAIYRIVSGTATLQGSAVSFTFAAGTAYNFRLRVFGEGSSILQARMWATGTSEPTTWNIAVTDLSAVLAGAPGLTGIAYNASPIKYQNFSVVNSVSTVPSAPTFQMDMSDLQAQYAVLRAARINAAIQTLATTFYGKATNSSTIYGELDVMLQNEDIDDLHELRTINEVTNFIQEYSYQSVVLSDLPAIYDRLGESSGFSAYDATSHYAASTISGSGVTLGVTGPLSGNAATCMSFNAGSVTLPSTFDTKNWTACTIECWFNAAVTPTDYWRLGANGFTSSSKQGIELMVAPSGALGYFNIGTGGAYTGVTIGSSVAVAGTWYHIVAVYGGGNIIVYVNGVSSGSSTTTSLPIAASGYQFAIGYNPAIPGEHFDGSIAEFAIYSYALTQAQAQNHYNIGIGNF